MVSPEITATANEKFNKETSAGSRPWEGREGVGVGAESSRLLHKGKTIFTIMHTV